MKLKRLYVVLLAVILCTFISLGSTTYAEDTAFSSDNVYNITKELSKSEYRGRLAGDTGNEMAAQYIYNCFKSLGIKPAFNNGSYFQNFNVFVPSVNDKCLLKVLNKDGRTIKEYKYGEDFKEITYGDVSPGNINGIVKTDKQSKGNILLQQNSQLGENPSFYEEDKQFKFSGIDAIIYEVNGDFRYRSPYKLQVPNSGGLAKLMVSKTVFNEIKNFAKDGYSISIHDSLNIKKAQVKNVAGIIEGTNSSLPPIILSCHFDHVGFDADGTVYPGALDNASGTALLLECARILVSSPRERTIILAAFNAEEEGLLGSKYFVEHPPIDITHAECINFDMVASPKNIPLTLLSSVPSMEYANYIQKLMRSESVSSRILYENNSDHASFSEKNINAVTFIYFDRDKIHTPEDTMENVDKAKFIDVYNILCSYLNTKDLSLASAEPAKASLEPLKKMIIILSVVFILAAGLYYVLRNRLIVMYSNERELRKRNIFKDR